MVNLGGMGTCVNIELSVNIVYIAIFCLMLIMNYVCEKLCSEQGHFEFFQSLCISFFLYFGVFVIFPHISSFSLTLTYISLNDQVSR